MADQLTPSELSQALVGREIRCVAGRLEGRAGAEGFTTLSIRLDDRRVVVVTPEGSRLAIDLVSPGTLDDAASLIQAYIERPIPEAEAV